MPTTTIRLATHGETTLNFGYENPMRRTTAFETPLREIAASIAAAWMLP